MIATSSDIPAGFKQTEAGVIPDDWRVEVLDECVRNDAPICYGILMPGKFHDGGVPVIKVKDIMGGRVDEMDILLTHPTIDNAYKRSRLRSGDLLVTIRGTTGRIAIVPKTLDGGNITQDTARLRLNGTHSSEFLYFALHSRAAQDQIALHTIGQAVKGINIRDVKEVVVAVPPTLAEQEAIAEALGDADALIESLEQLVAKKRHLKQAAMQQLLTGKKRLPGFKGEWELAPLSSRINSLDAGVSVRSSDDAGDALGHAPAVLKTSCVDNGRFVPKECKRIDARDLGRAQMHPAANTILISRMNTIDLIGECGFVDRDWPNLYLPDRLWMTRFNSSVSTSAHWLSYVLSFRTYRELLRRISTGTSGSMKNMSKAALLSLELQFPSFDEQLAIAELLSGIDVEIEAIEAKLAKARQIKQGMMHVLLTGQVRLVTVES